MKNLEQYHNARLEFFLPAVNPDYKTGDPIYCAKGIALMTVSGPDIYLHPLDGDRFQPRSGAPFLLMIYKVSGTPEGSDPTTYAIGPQSNSFAHLVALGQCLVFEEPADHSIKQRVDGFNLWQNWKDRSKAEDCGES